MNVVYDPEADRNVQQFLCHLTKAIREVGRLVENIETSFLDSTGDAIPGALPHTTVQNLDLALQSIDELALISERIAPLFPIDQHVQLEPIIAQTRLEWLRRLILDGEKMDDNPQKKSQAGEIAMF